MLRIGGGLIQVGGGGKSKTQKQAAMFHEVGHVVHAQATFRGETFAGLSPYSGTRGTKQAYADEQAAWRLAEPFLAAMPRKGVQPVGRWTKAFALHTYRRGAEIRGKPIKITKEGKIIGG